MKAIWNNKVIAESDNTTVIENNHYFPVEDLKMEYFEEADTTSVCHWKGTANYYNVVVDGQTNNDAAWYYADPFQLAESIRGKVAFWKGVTVEP